jgi:cyclopropane-fatty-acyl-phospholipid synthase
MADQKDIDYHYTFVDKIWRTAVGKTADYTNALFDGDYSLPIEDAQRKKHEFMYENLKIGPGSRVLDIGCGWGPFLNFLREKDVDGVGVTLSASQVASCRKYGMDVHLMDCKKLKPETFGTFDAVVCVGAMEHFCSKEEWRAGRQDELYHRFFKTVFDLLPSGGRFYLQTGTLGKNMIDPEAGDIHAERDSDEYIVALLESGFPGSWLPSGSDQIKTCASPYFSVIKEVNGRLDYIQTQWKWRKKLFGFGLHKYLYYLSFVPAYVSDKRFRERIAAALVNPNRICFEREIMDHFRFVFEKQ